MVAGRVCLGDSKSVFSATAVFLFDEPVLLTVFAFTDENRFLPSVAYEVTAAVTTVNLAYRN